MVAELPKADWTQREDLAALVRALGADNIRWVGGAVRDTLLGVPVSDVDAATPFHPDQVISLLNEAGIRTVPTGIEHGTITAVLEGGPVEVTTLRRDVATDGRRATVAFAKEWREDAARRDFTINALFAHPETLAIDDYFGGLGDLDARRVRFIGDARQRIREDHLRILRYYRFQARFGADLDTEAEEACAELAETMKGLSRERVAGELLSILALPSPAPTIARMHERGVLKVILPETTQAQIAALEALTSHEKMLAARPDALRRLSALLPALPHVAEAVAARLRLSRKQRAHLSTLAARSDADAGRPKALAYEEGMDAARDRLLLAGAPVAALDGWEPPQFPLKGGEIVAMGLAKGPDVARLLQTVEAQWIEEGFPDRARVEAILSNLK
ncbi:CCA tRNA nucleotidyltransferase [Qipengyuania sp. DSG2-2]|uniref:CCA tRNA nucleotidyltransferase n=1 Tax=Qipengyuania sp. DGS2-2 TaxID=3349631 RepID=UPI0036D34D7D